jgi:predicted TIM-barrel fold metal-dependent hydrolase
MDLAGMVASVNYPSGIWGFAGQKFFRMKDHDLGLACLQAYNDWVVDVWCAADPQRLIAWQLPWFLDPEVAAAEIHRNAARGVPCVSFSENPEKLGLPSLYSDYWDPFFRACEETGTVINLHVGSSSNISKPSNDSPEEVSLTLFGANSMLASVDWLYAQIPVRFPDLKIVFAESGIGFLPMLIDRLQHIELYREYEMIRFSWTDRELAPVDVFRRNFWFTTYWDPTAFKVIEDIGPERVMLEVDYPHPDSIWPDVQGRCERMLGGLAESTIRRVTHQNASEVYRIDLPELS